MGHRNNGRGEMNALAGLSARERYILFEHILNERSYDALAKPLGLRYSGVSAAYHRIHSSRFFHSSSRSKSRFA